MRFTSVCDLSTSVSRLSQIWILYSDLRRSSVNFSIRNYAGRRGTRRRECGDSKESEETRFYRRNSINECVDSRLGRLEGRQLASILSIGRRVYGTLIRFVSPSASTVRRGTRERDRESEGARKSTWRGWGRRGNRGEHSRETMRGRLATVISENVS